MRPPPRPSPVAGFPPDRRYGSEEWRPERATIFDWGELRAQTLATLLPFLPIFVVHAGSAADLVMRLVERFF